LNVLGKNDEDGFAYKNQTNLEKTAVVTKLSDATINGRRVIPIMQDSTSYQVNADMEKERKNEK
jgi:hypothetical protein